MSRHTRGDVQVYIPRYTFGRRVHLDRVVPYLTIYVCNHHRLIMGHGEEEAIGTASLHWEGNLEVKPIKTWKGYIWDTWELPKDQRWLLFKLDAFVLTFASVRA